MNKEDTDSVNETPNTPFPEWQPPPPLDDDDPLGPPRIPTAEDLERSADYRWARDNLELRDLYPGQYVAVHQKKILAAGRDFLAVRAEAEAKSGLPRDKIVMADIDDMDAMLRE
jgi:Family of unknown function (DUF5678)